MARKIKKKYTLSRESIDMISSEVHAFLNGYSVENPIIIQVRLVLEELLLVLMNGIFENLETHSCFDLHLSFAHHRVYPVCCR